MVGVTRFQVVATQTLAEGTPISLFRLRLFGPPSLCDAAGATPPGLGWGKPLALLCLLAVRREVRRDEVVDLLWRGVDEDKARNAFRQALHRLRGAIGEELLPQDRERLRLITGESLDIDMVRFEAALAAGRLSEAIEISVGDFLGDASLDEPAFDMWVEQERARVRTRVGRLLTDATTKASAEGRLSDAIAWTHRLMSVAPYEASSAQLAATTLVSAGRRHEARDLLRRFASSLESDLGLGMPPELQALLARLDRQAAPTDAASAGSTPRRSVALPFVGREAELSQLVSLCRETSEESGGFALVKARSGMGKSRLLSELASHLKSLGRVTTLHGREHVAGIQLPFAVFAEALRPLARAPGVVGASRHLLAEAARLLPELRDEIDLPVVSDVEDDAGRLRFFEGVAALIDAAAFERPIVLVIDDTHLIGPSTLEMLAYLCARLSRSAVTFVIALNQEQAPASVLSRLESIARQDSQTHPGRTLSLSLIPLSADATRNAVTQVTASLGLDQRTADLLVSRADGDPARLADLVRLVARGEKIPTVPVSVRELTLDLIGRLSSSQRRLLFVIALIARPTTRSVVGAAAHLPPAAIDDAVDGIVAEGLVEVGPDGLIVIETDTARAALDVAGPSTRAFLAGWIADELASRDWRAAELARFFAAAGRARPALEHSRRAAFDALAVGAVPEATHHLQAARSLATSPEDAAAIESLLTAVGAGNRQIRSAEPSPAPSPRESSHAPAASAAAAPGRLTALFPHWRVLLGAAVATLIISALVLADRSPVVVGTAVGVGDTLWVADDASRRSIRFVTGDMSRGFTISSRRASGPSVPPWIDSLPRSWANPITAPRGENVAVERVAGSGSDVFSISADRRDTTPLLVGVGDARALGWSPDGRWVLATLAPADGSSGSRLFALHESSGSIERRVLEASPQRSVVEAAWSPDGTRIAWVARVGAERQLEVFMSDADGANVRNVSRDPADDHHIVWSPDGRLLAFTSTRDGNAELYALSFVESRLWRLTFDPAQDDAARFSPDSRLIAYESTRGGEATVYVMPALGGDAQRIEATSSVSVLRWTGRIPRYVDRVLIEQPGRLRRGDSANVRLFALDQLDEPVTAFAVRWSLPDSLLTLRVESDSSELGVRSRKDGVARLIATVGGWRSDTALIVVGSSTIRLLQGTSEPQIWRALGAPRPTIGAASSVLVSDREWESGLLSRNTIPLVPGLVLQATLQLPFSDLRDAAAAASVAFVAPEDTSTIDFDAPQFLRYASVSWNAESSRLVYAVGREAFSEQVASVVAAGDAPLAIQLRIEEDSTISFRVGSQQRWRSTLRVLSSRRSSRGQVWISSRATGDRVRLTNVAIRVEPIATNNP